LLTLISKAQFNKDLKDHRQRPLVYDIESVFGYNHCHMADIRLNISEMSKGKILTNTVQQQQQQL
jgi:hypothetical protein